MSSTCNVDRLKATLFGLYVGDATAMPVHWHYDLNQLKRDYGTVTGYMKPRDRFDGSILNLSNTGGDAGDPIKAISSDRLSFMERKNIGLEVEVTIITLDCKQVFFPPSNSCYMLLLTK